MSMLNASTVEEVMGEILDSKLLDAADKSMIRFINKNVNKYQMKKTIADAEGDVSIRSAIDLAANYWYDYIRDLPGYDNALLDPLLQAGIGFTKPELKHAFDILDLPYASGDDVKYLREAIGEYIRKNYDSLEPFYEDYLDWVENTAIGQIAEQMNKHNLIPEKYV